ncbi:hypothetical protein [Lysobacter soli]|uniref:hypothetical protein n=1 Tax=Lysobacter soli TaxID=453783 RepID=UPI0024103BA4|nr:hypothetical protein [Lysobacter soli]MDG2517581.1 hypothetical protein [Lysobacter soli]
MDSRLRGNDSFWNRFGSRGIPGTWIPAFAGMTAKTSSAVAAEHYRATPARTRRANGFNRYQTPAHVAQFPTRDQRLETPNALCRVRAAGHLPHRTKCDLFG